MTCDGCASRLKRVLEARDGIQQADVRRDLKLVAVDYDGATTDRAAIEAAIGDAGFEIGHG
ncbi:heavy-metal-associated domain-containing protein [Novosphingobium clariflavum]|uniref:Heavy-metal-associated domain-containing protein n=1 Tax=Novosphingobium clariflavum TaxID=2029884 RepID=A0ABV6SBN4_9SPHN|nr:heavy-metal-associated domain-containing protein [Novosphingobium clariflavum]